MAAVCGFLDMIAADAAALYVLGDLFDFWLERPKAMQARCGEVLSRLKSLAESGVQVNLILGNRDFAMDGFFERELKCKILGDSHELMLGGKRVHLSHGDFFCTRDRWYQRWRRVIRSWPVRAGFAVLPTFFILWCIAKFRDMSRREIKRKTSDEINIVPEEVAKVFKRGFDMVFCGHVHTSQHQDFDIDGKARRLEVIGGWDEGSPYLVWDGERLEHKEFSKTNDHVRIK